MSIERPNYEFSVTDSLKAERRRISDTDRLKSLEDHLSAEIIQLRRHVYLWVAPQLLTMTMSLAGCGSSGLETVVLA